MQGTALQAALLYKKYESSQDSCIVIVDVPGYITYVNDNFCELSGYSQEDLVGKNNDFLNSDIQAKSYLLSIYKAMRKGNIWHDEVRYKAKDGHYFWVDRTIIPFLDSEGKPETYVSIHVDITHQKELANTLSSQTFAIEQHSVITETDINGSITYVNDKFCELSGYSKEDLIGKNHRILNSANQPKSYWKAMYETVAKGNIWQDEVRNKARSGDYYWVDTTIVPRMDLGGKLHSYISIRTDISEQKKLEDELLNQKFAMDQHAIIASTDVSGAITYANDKFVEVSGYSLDELIGKDHRILNSGNKPKSYWKEMYETVASGNIWKDQVKNIARNGSYYWVDTSIIPFLDEDGKINSYISIRTDITHQKKIEEVLSNQRFAMDQHSIIAIADIDGAITYANDKFCDISGYSVKELIGQDHRILNSGNQPKSYWKEMYEILKEDGVWQDEVKNKAKDGSYYWVDTTIVPFLDSKGKIDCYVSIRTDITKYKKIQEELEEYRNNLEEIVKERTSELEKLNDKLKTLSEVDPLTELANRRRFETDFYHELKRWNRFDGQMALFFLDLDNFKSVNDESGHETGDALLQHVSSKMLQLLRGNEYLYRMGGDEFCVFIPEFNDKKELEALANRLIKEISAIEFLNGVKVNIGCSIGIAIWPEDGDTLSELMSTADKAMYSIKNADKGHYSFSE